jgi:hypothetical protein
MFLFTLLLKDRVAREVKVLARDFRILPEAGVLALLQGDQVQNPVDYYPLEHVLTWKKELIEA